MLVAMAYYITGITTHEIVGLVVLVLFIIHNFLKSQVVSIAKKGEVQSTAFSSNSG